MAPNKRKILEAARKFVQKGAKDKALKEYGRLLKLDPRDAKLRLEIGDAHRRWGQVDDAIAAYTKVAEQYMAEGFDARAIAVFKQIQGLDPERWASYLPLAELYQRMGLNSEAVQALQVAADGLNKSGDKRQALELLRRMATLDPTNTASRIKVADLLCQEEMNDEAIAEYDAAHSELERQGEAEGAAKVLERILEIDPDRVSTLSALGRNLVAREMAQRAEPFVKRALEIEPDETGHYELLADIYHATKRDDELTATYRSLADVYRQRGDEDRARSITQRFVPPEELAPSFDPADSFSASEQLVDETLLDEEELLEEELLEEVVEPGTLPAEAATPKPAAASATEPELTFDLDPSEAATPSAPQVDPELSAASLAEQLDDEPPPQGDPDQLLAEANVYLRYGKRAKAIHNLSAVLDAEPRHRVALEKLGEAHADGDDTAKAVAAWVRAAELAHDSGDNEALGVLRDRVAAIDPDAVSRMPEAAIAEIPEEAIDEMLGDAPTASAEPEPADDEESIDIEFELNDPDELSDPGDVAGDELLPVEPGPDAAAAEPEAEVPEVDESIEIEALDLDDDIEIDDSALDDGELDDSALDDSELEDPLGLSLGDDAALDDASELESLDEDDLAAVESELDDGPGDTAPQLEAVSESVEDEDDVNGLSLPDAEASQAASGLSASLSFTSKVNDDLEEAEFYHQQGLLEEAREIYERVLEMAPNHPLALVRMGEIQAETEASGDADAAPEVAIDDTESAPADVAQSADEFSFGSDAAGVSQPALETGDDSQSEEDRELEAESAELPPIAEAEDDSTSDATPEWELSDDEEEGAEVEADELFVDDPAAVALEDAAISEATAAELSLDADEEVEASGAVVQTDEDPAGASYDLAAELSGFFDDDSGSNSAAASSSGVSGSAEQDVFSAVFSEFKKGVSAQLEEGDHETRYDLGIAYREMGLLEDAVGEFEMAVQGGERQLECLHLLGLCNLDLGRTDEAVTHLQTALDSVDPTAQEATALRFDLGRAFELAGRMAEAREAWEAVAAVDASFGEVEERLAALGEAKPEAVVEDDMESFEEFFQDEDSDDEEEDTDGGAVAAQEHESFEDLVEEANADAVDVAPEPAADPEPEAAPEPAPEPSPEANAEPTPYDEPKPRRRKKKISFV